MALRQETTQEASWILVTIATIVLFALVCVAFQMVQDLKNVYEKADQKEKHEAKTQFMYIDKSTVLHHRKPLVVSRSCSSFFEEPIDKLKKMV